MPPREDERYDVHLVTKIEGVTLPTWLAVALAISAILAAITFLDASRQLASLAKEVRVLQLHAQDIESVLVRNGIAKRSDFATWSADSAPGRRAAAEEADQKEK